MAMPIYQSEGTLTGTIPSERVEEASRYLTGDDMTKYLYPPLSGVIEHIEWRLGFDGHTYCVVAIAKRELTEDELAELASWTSGQNSDGLGEGFEQQDFAWINESYNSWGDPDGDGEMVSFDWKTNDSTFTLVKSS